MHISKFAIGIVVLAFIVPGFFIFAQSEELSPSEERTLLEQELQELEKQIQLIEGDITKTQQEKKSFQNDIYVLRNRIKKLNLQIEQSNIIIFDLQEQIGDTSTSITRTEESIVKEKDQLGKLLLRLYQEDNKSKAEILLTGSSLSDFFNNVVALEALSAKNKQLLSNIEELYVYLTGQKDALETEKSEEENFVKIQILQKQESSNVKAETEQLLSTTQGKESEYKRLLADRQKEAQQIRSRIFELIGVPNAPTFGEAVEIAKAVSTQTGVRPALLLAVLTQESNIGKNVGQCFLINTKTGAGVSTKGTNFSNVMKPTRDVQPFLQITKELGRDPFATPVSCPIPSIGGYGGAMGPAQFIPSTWAGYQSRLAVLKGSPADPWDIKDAFLASGLYLADGGAAKQTYNAEWCAAQRYFSGRCSTKYRFYGDSVMALAQKYDQDIKKLDEAR